MTVLGAEYQIPKAQFADTEGLKLEPSALAGMYGPVLMMDDPVLADYPSSAGISHETMNRAVHLVWATGGSMVPPEEMQQYYESGKRKEI